MKYLLIAALIFYAATAVNAQPESSKIDPWTNYMTPGKTHQFLGQYTGDWNWEITMWMSADQKPEILNIGSTNRMILGNRFLELAQQGDMMGMAYEARTVIGFNNASKKIELTTYTNMGTGTLYLTGTMNSSNSAELLGTIVNPVDGTQITVRQFVNFLDSDTIIIENYDKVGSSAERKSVVYKLTRKN